jgi:hypothetical protein
MNWIVDSDSRTVEVFVLHEGAYGFWASVTRRVLRQVAGLLGGA